MEQRYICRRSLLTAILVAGLMPDSIFAQATIAPKPQDRRGFICTINQ